MQENFIAGFQGLTSEEVLQARLKYGENRIKAESGNGFLRILRDIVLEPMFLLLLVASLIYFVLGEYSEGMIMLVAILLVSGISLFQELRSKSALDELRKLTRPQARLIRDGKLVERPTVDVVMGDLMVVEEGNVIPADGRIISSNDFAVNESLLTGEAFPVEKDKSEGNCSIFQGTTVTGGLAIAEVSATGMQTELGQIGTSMESIEISRTPLQLQIRIFVRSMAIAGALAFVLVWAANFLLTKDMWGGLLHGLTLAMSVLPEEIPVAFATFMALGAWRMMQNRVLARHASTVESLGSATVICVDKTGTITENHMQLAKVYDPLSDQILESDSPVDDQYIRIVSYAMWSSEPIPFDPMEIAIHNAYTNIEESDLRGRFKMFHEYPLEGSPPMMTHLHTDEEGNRIIAAKGAVERILIHAGLTHEDSDKISRISHTLASKGFRVLGVASTKFEGDDFPQNQEDFDWHFEGLVAFYDPPKKNVSAVLKRFYEAGIKVKMITGDYPETAVAIAKKVGFQGYEQILSGETVMKLSDSDLELESTRSHLFARMFPEAKLKVVEALKRSGEIVAMTGDGVNDGPALKAAHIGVAMGKRGTEIAKRASALVLLDDDLDKIADSVALGRKIYTNLKKAVQYIISIHIPIILTVMMPLLLGWKFPNIFSPVHVIFLELIMGPTCSIIFENEPMEANLMKMRPRKMSRTFLSIRELSLSIVQGLMITLGVLFIYRFSIGQGNDADTTRTLVFATLVFSNIFLTLVNRSFYYSVLTTLSYRNPLMPLIILITVLILVLILLVPAVRQIFDFAPVSVMDLIYGIGVAFISVFWLEIYKAVKRNHSTGLNR